LQAKVFYTSHGFEQVGIQWDTRDIPQDLAVSFMHQLSSHGNSLSNLYHWHLACYHLAYYYHLAFLQASDSVSDASAEELKQRQRPMDDAISMCEL
jgi:hypothetical protein